MIDCVTNLEELMRRAMATGLLAFLSCVSVAEGQQLNAVSTTLASRLEQSGRKTVAVVDFTDLQGRATELGRYLAEELSVMLATSAKGFTVIDRTHLKSILQEHKLASTGLIDSQTARQLGKIAGVDTLITGALTPFGDTVRLVAKALDTQTATVLAATAADIPRTKAVEELLGRSMGGSSTAASGTTASPGPSQGATQRIQGVGVTLELVSCHKSGTCQLFLTADDDIEFVFGHGGLRAGVRAWDQSGNQYDVKDIRIGNRAWRADLVAGVRTPVVFNFEFSIRTGGGFGTGTKSTASSVEVETLAAIEVEFRGAGERSGAGRFRNVPVR